MKYHCQITQSGRRRKLRISMVHLEWKMELLCWRIETSW